jgi:hypothetical protein
MMASLAPPRLVSSAASTLIPGVAHAGFWVGTGEVTQIARLLALASGAHMPDRLCSHGAGHCK